ncbi:hypothetical protein EU545_00965 [Candidatus Thorarchaeota archaeon]|nr:MAG: hypothetical protein EU545_00965 [Candidatus Thorarchaeota archaeon]
MPNKKQRYSLKITLVGPDDELLESVLAALMDQTVAVDGIRIGSAGMETKDSDVRALIMSPRDTAMDLLFSLSYRGATGALIVLPEVTPELETEYRNEVRENLGDRYPTRVFEAGDCLDEDKCAELAQLFTDLLEEMLEQRQKR